MVESVPDIHGSFVYENKILRFEHLSYPITTRHSERVFVVSWRFTCVTEFCAWTLLLPRNEILCLPSPVIVLALSLSDWASGLFCLHSILIPHPPLPLSNQLNSSVRKSREYPRHNFFKKIWLSNQFRDLPSLCLLDSSFCFTLRTPDDTFRNTEDESTHKCLYYVSPRLFYLNPKTRFYPS